MTPTTLSVVIPTYHRSHLIVEVLTPLLHDPAPLEILVVNDGGTDATGSLVQDLATQDQRLRWLDQPHRGRQGARRAGVQAARGEVVLLLDDDVRADPGLAGGHLDAHRRGMADVIEGYMPVALPPARRAGQAATFLYAAEYEQHCLLNERDPASSLLRLWGGNISMSRELALEATGGSEFPVSFGEDTHYGLRCLRAGAAGRFLRELSASHLHSRQLAQFLQDSRDQGASIFWLHEWHHDLLGEARADRLTANVPGLFRHLLEARPSAARRIGCRAATASGRVGAYGAETAATRLARRAAMIEGFEEASAGWSAGEDPHPGRDQTNP